MSQINRFLCGVFVVSLFSSGCGVGLFQKKQASTQDNPNLSVALDTATVRSSPKNYPYRAADTRQHDLLHTKLDVRFNWEKQYLLGKATLRFTPYFYPTDSLVLDAKGFDIHEVSLVNGNQYQPLDYTYPDSMALHIQLDSTYTRHDTLTIFIDYTAKPNELPSEGSQAIDRRKGLYFINPLGKTEGKPRQIWTQGETEANSRWFPTIDAPNERCTQEMYITVNDKYETLSNGEFVYSTQNEDGTRTDYWRQNKPHAPYLFMMAIGKYAVVEDEWEGMNVNYYVEPDYKDDAKAIFGNTPEMIDYFSDTLGYPYPWAKYSQVIVRDFVAGAMENTSASVFMEFVQNTQRELIDRSWDGIIAHELIHHWFGDLVTCESWANIALNEAFATYGEYLWFEHHFGQDRADYHHYKDMQGYLREARNNQRPIIDFHYPAREKMFDAHSYNKGGQVLHMLRHKVGDNAFFQSLQYYLKEHEYSAVEIDELRLAFEEVTGKDLKPFFNQWFHSPGHPVLDIRYSYNDSAGVATVFIAQEKSTEKAPVYHLPIKIDVYHGPEKVTRHSVTIDSAFQVFRFSYDTRPELINVEAENKLLCEKQDYLSTESAIFQYKHAPHFRDRWESIQHLEKVQDTVPKAQQTLLRAVNDSFWGLRRKAIRSIRLTNPSLHSSIKKTLAKKATHDPISRVRAAALDKLAQVADSTHLSLYEQKTKDSSYAVISSALNGLAQLDSAVALQTARQFRNTDKPPILLAISNIYAQTGNEKDYSFFQQHIHQINGRSQYRFIGNFSHYLLRLKDLELIHKGGEAIGKVTQETDRSWVQARGIASLVRLQDFVEQRKKKLEKHLNELEDGTPEYTKTQKQLTQVKQTLDPLEDLLSEIRSSG